MTVNIHSRSQEAVHLICDHFKTGLGKKFCEQCPIKGTCHHCAVWQTESFGAAVQAHAGRTVIAATAWNAEGFQLRGNTAECGSSTGSDSWAVHALSADHTGEVVIGHLGNKLFHGVGAFSDIPEADALIAGKWDFLRKIFQTAFFLVHLRKGNGFHLWFVSVCCLYRLDAFKCFYRSESLFVAGNHKCPVLCTSICFLCLTDIGSYIEMVVTFFQNKAVSMTGNTGVIIGCDLCFADRDGNRLGFAR